MSDVVLVEGVAPHVRLIKLNRPEQLNALAGTMREDLLGAIEKLVRDSRSAIVPWQLDVVSQPPAI